jgi:ribonuclease HII
MAARFDPALIPSAPDISFEQALSLSRVKLIAGLDESGRGAWAGPVSAGVVILDPRGPLDHLLGEVRDSKELIAEKRRALEPVIKRTALYWGVGFASNEEIDQIGILPATRLAMTRALAAMGVTPQHLLLDALFLPDNDVPQTALIKGDQRSLSIAAASILAKTARDRFMMELAVEENRYSFEHNKGYGTYAHQKALSLNGPCVHHRFTYEPIKLYIK